MLFRVVLLELLGLSCGSPGTGGILGTCVGPDSQISGCFETLQPICAQLGCLCCCHMELMAIMARMDAGYFCSNNIYFPVVWLSPLLLSGTQLRGCGCTTEINFLQASSPSPENLVEKDLSPNQTVSHSRFPRPWGLPEQGANLCGVYARHAAGGSAPGMCECLPGKAVTPGSKYFLSGREWWAGMKQPGYTSISVFEQ